MSEEKKFDLRTHIRDPKTGQIEKAQPYRLVIEGGKQTYHRGGKSYYGNGEEIISPSEQKMRKEAALEKAKIEAEMKLKVF